MKYISGKSIAAYTNPIATLAPSFKQHSASNLAKNSSADDIGQRRCWRATLAKSPGDRAESICAADKVYFN